MNWAAAMLPPVAFVKATNFRACSGVHTPAASPVPGKIANDVTIPALAAGAKSKTPFHCCLVRTESKPAGGVRVGASRESW